MKRKFLSPSGKDITKLSPQERQMYLDIETLQTKNDELSNKLTLAETTNLLLAERLALLEEKITPKGVL